MPSSDLAPDVLPVQQARAAGRPRIGIAAHPSAVTWGPWREIPASFVTDTYLRAVEEAGGAPLLVPALAAVASEPDVVLDVLDGLMVIGGEDVEPAMYGAERDIRTGPASPIRDSAESALLSGAVRRGIPTLAICRGCQLLNVVRGGTLIQDVGDVTDVATHRPVPGQFGEHGVELTDGRLRDIFGSRTTVRSHHHQGIERLGRGLVATAHSDDGLIEGIELRGQRFCVGVVWHPEEHVDRGTASLFGCFVREAGAQGELERAHAAAAPSA